MPVTEEWIEDGENLLLKTGSGGVEVAAYCDGRARYEETGYTGTWDFASVSEYLLDDTRNYPEAQTSEIVASGDPALRIDYPNDEDHWVVQGGMVNDQWLVILVEITPEADWTPELQGRVFAVLDGVEASLQSE